MRTLVLDQGYQPHRIVSWQKGISLFFGGKVDVVEEYDDIIRSVSLAVRMPAVVRLRSRIPYRKPYLKFSRINVLRRDGYACQYCGTEGRAKELTLDHVVPKAQGGQTTWENIVAACRPCNEKKGARTPAEAGKPLKTQPRRPSFLPNVVGGTGAAGDPRGVPDGWKNWMPNAVIQG